MTHRILVVEDEALMMQGLRHLLTSRGYEVIEAVTGPEALIKASAARPDLLMLDVMLPGLSGFDVLKALRGEGNRTPVIMLTSRGAEMDKVLGFQLGVDDYVTKPFSVLELLGRVEAVLRRAAPAQVAAPEALALGEVEVDFQRLQLRREGQAVELPERAIELLRVLVEADGQIVTRDGLIDRVWGVDQAIGGRRVDNLVVKLRQAIEADPAMPRHILTVHGRGYRFVRTP
ncbi:MAG: response regulator transcription factor [Cyanobacteria bacterium RYN_339]|nr:response regulator transcription factor [Cyanobacteria bacterium RYN_339]